MPHVKFQHVFASLLVLSALSAFVLSPRITNPSRAAVQGIFAPVAWPTNAVAGWVHDRFAGDAVDNGGLNGTARTPSEIIEENRRLRDANAALTIRIQALSRIDAELASLKDVRDYCVRARVTGADTGLRQSISLQATSLSGLQTDMPVISADRFIVGKIDRVGVGGAQVRLITDSGFALTGTFGRFTTNEKGQTQFVQLKTNQPLAFGSGKGTLLVQSLSMKDLQDAGVHEGDVLVLDDPDWPTKLQGFNVGRVTKIAPQLDSPLHAEVVVQPSADLMKLREVLVMVKE
jgi:cell shape-determining protein MreC